jgi:hypothetical protein
MYKRDYNIVCIIIMYSNQGRGGRGGGRGGNHNNGNGQRIEMISDMWYATFVHKLMYDEIPKNYKGLTFTK